MFTSSSFALAKEHRALICSKRTYISCLIRLVIFSFEYYKMCKYTYCFWGFRMNVRQRGDFLEADVAVAAAVVSVIYDLQFSSKLLFAFTPWYSIYAPALSVRLFYFVFYCYGRENIYIFRFTLYYIWSMFYYDINLILTLSCRINCLLGGFVPYQNHGVSFRKYFQQAHTH